MTSADRFNPSPTFTVEESFILNTALDSFEKDLQLRGMNHKKHWLTLRGETAWRPLDYFALIVELRKKIAPGYDPGLRYGDLNPGAFVETPDAP